MWIPSETKDPVLRHFPSRKSVGSFGAVRLRDGKVVYRRETGKFNAETFIVFRRQVRHEAASNWRRVVMITDNAKYHHVWLHKSWRAHVARRLELDFLPPYSPELNPSERVWKLTRRLCLHKNYFPTLDAVTTVVETQFGEWKRGNNTLRRLCAIT